MPRSFKLTWQSGVGKRTGRWRKIYKGKARYFEGGRGKSDRDAYDAAVAEWEKLKLRIDADAPKPHQADYERAILEWEAVLAWCRKHNDAEMADVAITHQAVLRRGLSALKPRPVQKENTFAGQFDRSVRHPDLHEAIVEIGELVAKASETIAPPHAYAESVIVPNASIWDAPDPLRLEREVWRDRLEVMRRSAVPTDQTLEAHVEQFLAEKKSLADAGELTEGHVYRLGIHLTHFMDWLGHGSPVVEINGKTVSEYRLKVLQNVEAEKWSRTTAKDRLGSVKSFIRWLWQIDAIPSLPRNMDGKSNALRISKPSPVIRVFEKKEITKLLREASDRTKLYILLMLNCGMTQKDIADLDITEVDWKLGRITRKRSKTKGFESVPKVRYPLWRETFRLLRQERNAADTGLVLLNKNDGPLWSEEIQQNGTMKKNDNVRNAFHRLRQKTGINKPPKSLKKTSASLIRNDSKYASLERLFLGHAPQSMSDKHYTVAPQTLLDEAIAWLGTEYGIVVGEESSEQD